ncbi:MAG: PepSY-like domain-containing protein [Acidobacteriota bacterium]|nr:PepSY-like domain-containing protein [Acidobacteriota bacterium]
MRLAKGFVRFALVVTAMSLLGLYAEAQEKQVKKKQVPPAVIAAFNSAYPQATVRGYAREKENGKTYYEVESMDGQTTRDILYNPDGTVAEIEEGIPVGDLPADARAAMAAKYPNAVITKAEKITRGDITEYEAHGRSGKKGVSMEFDASGKPLKKG